MSVTKAEYAAACIIPIVKAMKATPKRVLKIANDNAQRWPCTHTTMIPQGNDSTH
eukprot:m.173720 g.173720  ORF g.173720 m.173720 type:complete len:55 (+) comp14587_c0_seq3:3048-3212(+)